MNRKKLCELESVLVPFEASKLEGAEVIYLNDDFRAVITDRDTEQEYGYVIEEDADQKAKRVAKTFQAERYGGDGILRNGGGARCGFDGRFQVKGIGANQLVGGGVDPAHANGLLALESAIYEAIWGEIIHRVLPYGAARSVAIIDTRLNFNLNDREYCRGLLVREAFVRPAHFIRAVYFKPAHKSGLQKDYLRVKAAMKNLVNFLPLNTARTDITLEEKLKFGMVELARRHAEQFAMAKSKHIIHYNVSASNVCIEGGWIDLTGAMIFSDIINGDKRDVDRFEAEYSGVVTSIKALCFNFVKYLGLSQVYASEVQGAAMREFNMVYARTQSLCVVSRAGFPWCLNCELESSAEFLGLSKCLMEVIELECYSVAPTSKTASWDGYGFWAGHVFKELLELAAAAVLPDAYLARIKNRELASRLLVEYLRYFRKISKMAASQGVTHEALMHAIGINCTKLSRTPKILQCGVLRDEIKNLVSLDRSKSLREAVSSLINGVMEASLITLRTDKELTIVCWETKSLKVHLNMLQNEYVVSRNSDSPTESYSIEEFLYLEQNQQGSEFDCMFKFYKGVWNA